MNRLLSCSNIGRWTAAIACVVMFEGLASARTAPFYSTTPGASTGLTVTARALAQPHTEWLGTRTTICHISRHPRDGGRAPLRVCPVMLADARAGALVPDTRMSSSGYLVSPSVQRQFAIFW